MAFDCRLGSANCRLRPYSSTRIGQTVARLDELSRQVVGAPTSRAGDGKFRGRLIDESSAANFVCQFRESVPSELEGLVGSASH